LEYSHDAFHVEHIIPPKKGGSNDLENLAFACDGCNTNKGFKTDATDPETGNHHALFDPRKEKWSDHFSWNSDFTQIIGLTPAGRTTVDALQLNRPGLLKVRAMMFAYGVHPPQ
jgi:hypothetical protein